MRFAGHRIEDYFAGPNMGKLVGGAEQINAREKTAGIQAQTQVASANIYGDATKKAGEVLGAAEAAAGRDAMWGQVFQTVGQVGGKALSTFGPDLSNPTPTPKTSNTDYSSAFNDPYNIMGELSSADIYSRNWNIPGY